MSNIQLTLEDLKNILNGNLYDKYPVSFDNIPENGNPQDFIEDDGRQYRMCIFKDNNTNIEYGFHYTWNPNWNDDLKYSFANVYERDTITIVTKIMTPQVTIIEDKPENNEPKKLWDIYQELEGVQNINDMMDILPMSVFNNGKEIFNDKNQSISEFKNNLIKICIEYKIEQSSFLRYLQTH